MVLIRQLLLDAQSKFRKMVEDNKRLALRIDGSIQSANEGVSALRAELADTNRRLSQLSGSSSEAPDTAQSVNSVKCGSESGCENDNNRVIDTKEVVAGLQQMPCCSDEDSVFIQSDCSSTAPCNLMISRLEVENVHFQKQITCMQQELEEAKREKDQTNNGKPSYGELKLELIQTRQELSRAKEALQAMKSDRKRLKAEKVELLHQMKQLYTTLDDKESELRHFIRNYEQRMQESDESIKQLALEKEESEREKWEIIKKARESAERAVILRTQMDARDLTIKELQEELFKLKEQLRIQELHLIRESNAATPTLSSCQDGQDSGVPSINKDSAQVSPSLITSHPFDGSLSKDDSFQEESHITSTPNVSEQGADTLSPIFKWLSNSSNDGMESSLKASKKKRKSFGSISKVFSRGRSRRSIAVPHSENIVEDGGGMKLSLLTSENYQEKLKVLDQMRDLHMCYWRAGQVLAWLEITLAMPMYGCNCALNVKSGKILLGLSDSELGAALGITNHIHRRKLRLAIEEYRDPAQIKFPRAPSLDSTWVAHRLLPDFGLPQYSHVFEMNLVDGRILSSLSRKDLEKYFDVHRKFHQASILHGIELLRQIEFNKEKLNERRRQCEEVDTDLFVWTCSRVIKWTNSIDLVEFSDNLRESGVHGALMVLEPSFNADTLATALGIPPSKSYIRRHLATELDTLLRPARAALDTGNNNSKPAETAFSGYTFKRSYRGQHQEESNKGRLSFRGSLGRAFGKKIRDDLKLAFDSESTRRKISAPIPIQHTTLDNVLEIAGDSTAV